MLPIDVQAELILSFQREKRQQYEKMIAQQKANRGKRVSLRARLLRGGGDVLVAAGRHLQRAAGLPAVEFDGRQFGWEK
jgi:hypothetical protein